MLAQSMGETSPMGFIKFTINVATATFMTNPIPDTIINLKNCFPMPLVSLLSNV